MQKEVRRVDIGSVTEDTLDRNRMPRCRNCGAEISDTQAFEFGERCPACVRLQQRSRTDMPSSGGEATVWQIVMLASAGYAVVSLVGPLVLLSWMPSIPGFNDITAMVLLPSIPYVAFGIIGVWFGHYMYKKTSQRTNL